MTCRSCITPRVSGMTSRRAGGCSSLVSDDCPRTWSRRTHRGVSSLRSMSADSLAQPRHSSSCSSLSRCTSTTTSSLTMVSSVTALQTLLHACFSRRDASLMGSTQRRGPTSSSSRTISSSGRCKWQWTIRRVDFRTHPRPQRAPVCHHTCAETIGQVVGHQGWEDHAFH
jgi:hypothetical protein